MKKTLIFSTFIIATFLMFFVIFFSLDNIKNDVYSLIALNSKDTEILQNMQQKNAKEIMFLSTDFTLLESIKDNNLFKDFILKHSLDENFLEILNSLKLATLKREIYNKILNNPKEFFLQNARDFYNPFVFRQGGKDFLNFSMQSSLLNMQNLSLDFKTQALSTTHNGEIYYFAKATLNDNFNSSKLLEFYKDSKQKAKTMDAKLLIVGNEIFASFAKNEGNKEGIIMSIFAFLLIGIFLVLAFKSLHILKLSVVIIFSFLCALSGGFLALNSISLLSIVISISLVGLILDFSMHFLSFKQNAPIKAQNIRQFLRVFLMGLFITSFGYALFALAPMRFLKEIATLSIFSLIGAFLVSYFLLPYLLEGVQFKSTKIFNNFVNFTMRFNGFLILHKKYFIILFSVIFIASCVFLYHFLPKVDFNDNIKNYSSLKVELTQEMQNFLNITNNNFPSSFIALNIKDLKDSIEKEMELLGALNITNAKGISQFLLSINEQDRLKLALKNAMQDKKILEQYTKLGINEHLVSKALLDLSNQKSINLLEFLEFFKQNKNPLESFLLDNKTQLIFVESLEQTAQINNILESFGAKYYNLPQKLNEYFTQTKYIAIYLKIFAFIFAFLIFFYFFGFLRAVFMLSAILFATFFSIILLLVLGVHFNIFCIFGLILASTIGIDYVLFAFNSNLNLQERYFGILCANLTSLISFALLMLSNTYALFSFGLSACICMFLCAFFALLIGSLKC